MKGLSLMLKRLVTVSPHAIKLLRNSWHALSFEQQYNVHFPSNLTSPANTLLSLPLRLMRFTLEFYAWHLIAFSSKLLIKYITL